MSFLLLNAYVFNMNTIIFAPMVSTMPAKGPRVTKIMKVRNQLWGGVGSRKEGREET